MSNSESQRRAEYKYADNKVAAGYKKVCVRPHVNDRDKVLRFVEDLNDLRRELEKSA